MGGRQILDLAGAIDSLGVPVSARGQDAVLFKLRGNLLRSEIEKQSSRATSTDMFVSIVRKYTRARKLTPRMLNELVEKIEVYNAEKIDGEWVQRLRIHYNCVGEMNIPNEPALPIPAVTVNTRKGVFVSYTTDDRPAV